MRRLPTTMLLIPLGLCAAAAHADSVELVVLSNTNGQQVSTPRSLFVSLAQAGEISSNVLFSSDLGADGDGTVPATTQDISAVLYSMVSGPSNRSSVGFTTFDPSILPPIDGPDDPAGGGGSLIDEIATDEGQREVESNTGGNPPQDDPAGGYHVVVPLPGAGALAAIGIAGLVVRPRR
ncbi:MAG: hypothetical protein ACFCBV_04050 [Phycisphaerales bacterium]